MNEVSFERYYRVDVLEYGTFFRCEWNILNAEREQKPRSAPFSERNVVGSLFLRYSLRRENLD